MPQYSRLTLLDLKNRLTERVGNNTIFWTDREKGKAIMEAILIWQCMTGEFNRVFSIPAVGQAFYDVPKQVASIRRITVDSSPLTPTSMWELDMGYPGWQGVTGSAIFWAPRGINKIAVYPSPTSGSIIFEGYAEVPFLTGDGDYIQLGDEEISGILDYAHHYLTLKEGGKEFGDAKNLLSNFIQAAVLRNSRLLAVDFYRKTIGQDRDGMERLPRVPTQGGIRG